MSKTVRIVTGVIVILVIMLVVLKNSSIETSAIKVGVILPLSGNEAPVGVSIRESLELAVNEINSVGGIKGRNIQIVYEDSKSDPKIGVMAYNKLTTINRIQTVFSSVSGVSVAIAPLAEKDKVNILVVGSATPSISKAGDFIFRHNLLPEDEAQALSKYILLRGFTDIGAFVVKAESGQSYFEYFKKYFEASGGHIVDIEKYEKGTSDYRTNLTKMKSFEPKAVISLSYDVELGRLMKQAKELGFDTKWFSIYAAENQQTIDTGGDATNGLIFTSFYDSNATFASFQEFKANYSLRFGTIPGPYAGLGYDFMNILAKVMTECENPVDSVCIKDHLYNVKNYNGATGLISFDGNGDTRKEVIVKTISNGQFVKLDQQ